MVLVDTSVWIRFLSNREPYATELDRLLALDDVAGHELVMENFSSEIAAAAESFWNRTSAYIKRQLFPMNTLWSLFAIEIFMVAEWAGLTFTC